MFNNITALLMICGMCFLKLCLVLIVFPILFLVGLSYVIIYNIKNLYTSFLESQTKT